MSVQELQVQLDELHEVMDILLDLPNKLRHDIMVPLGKHAFFPGHVTHTNEVFVRLGHGHSEDPYYAEATASQARRLLDTRAAMLECALEGAQVAQQTEELVSSVRGMRLGAQEGTRGLIEVNEDEDQRIMGWSDTRALESPGGSTERAAVGSTERAAAGGIKTSAPSNTQGLKRGFLSGGGGARPSVAGDVRERGTHSTEQSTEQTSDPPKRVSRFKQQRAGHS